MFCKLVTIVCSSLMFLFVLLHDWIDLFPFNDLKTLDRHCSLRNKVIMTLINLFFVATYLGILLIYWHAPFSFHARVYLILCNILFLIGVCYSWYFPYFFGWPEHQVKELKQMYSETHTFLPKLGNNPAPDTLHVMFHIILIVNMIATFMLL